jgi:hypothetical protein
MNLNNFESYIHGKSTGIRPFSFRESWMGSVELQWILFWMEALNTTKN